MINIVCELKQEFSDKEMFYRYNIDGVCVWFTQHIDDGNIYSVGIRGNERLSGIEFYIEDGSKNDNYYPENVYIRLHERLFIEQIEAYIELLKYAKEMSESIMSIFSSEEHIKYRRNIIQKENE